MFASPLSEFCSALTYSRICRRRERRGDVKLPPAVSDFKATGIFAYFVPKKVNLEHPQSSAEARWEAWVNDSSFSEDSSRSAELEEVADWKAALAGRYASLRDGVTLPLVYPPQVPELPVDYQTRSQRDAAFRTVVNPLAEAMDMFGSERYVEFAEAMSSLEAVLYRLGGSRVLRHSLQTVHIES